MNTTWTPDYISKILNSRAALAQASTETLFSQTGIWITAPGHIVAIHEMDDDHLVNTICMIERVAHDIYSAAQGDVDRKYKYTPEAVYEWLHETPLYKALKREIVERCAA